MRRRKGNILFTSLYIPPTARRPSPYGKKDSLASNGEAQDTLRLALTFERVLRGGSTCYLAVAAHPVD